jgi:hypothetical protein
MDKPAIILDTAEELLQARLNQPRVSSEVLRQQREQHRLASEAFAKAAKNGTLKLGRAKKTTG